VVSFNFSFTGLACRRQTLLNNINKVSIYQIVVNNIPALKNSGTNLEIIQLHRPQYLKNRLQSEKEYKMKNRQSKKQARHMQIIARLAEINFWRRIRLLETLSVRNKLVFVE
jgi:hypothetical protein